MAYVSYEYNKERIKQWRLDNPDKYREKSKLAMRRVYARRKDAWLNISYIFRRILIDGY